MFLHYYTFLSVLRKDGAEVGVIDGSDADFVEVQKKVAHHPSAEHRIVAVFRVIVDVAPHPLSQRQSVPCRSVEEELLHTSDHFAHGLARKGANLNSAFDLAEDARERTLPEEDFGHAELFDDRGAAVVDVSPKEEALGSERVSLVGAAEVLPELRDGDVKVESGIGVEEAGDEVNEETVRRVLIGSQLHLHRAELHAPTDIIVQRYFEPH